MIHQPGWLLLCNKNSGLFFWLALFIDPAVNAANKNAHLRKMVSHIRSHTGPGQGKCHFQPPSFYVTCWRSRWDPSRGKWRLKNFSTSSMLTPSKWGLSQWYILRKKMVKQSEQQKNTSISGFSAFQYCRRWNDWDNSGPENQHILPLEWQTTTSSIAPKRILSLYSGPEKKTWVQMLMIVTCDPTIIIRIYGNPPNDPPPQIRPW